MLGTDAVWNNLLEGVRALLDNTVWILLLATLAEGIVLMHWHRREKQKAWECGRCHSGLAMSQASLLKLIRATDDWVGAMASLDIERALKAREELERAQTSARALLDMQLTEYYHPKRGTSYYLLAPWVRFNASGPVEDGDIMFLYADKETGVLSCRRRGEFLDGRFIRKGIGLGWCGSNRYG